MAGAVESLRHHIFYVAGTANGNFAITCWDDVGAKILAVRSNGRCVAIPNDADTSVQAALPIVGGLLLHTWCPWTRNHFGIERLAVGPPGSLVALTSCGNAAQMVVGAAENEHTAQWPPPECSARRWLFSAAIVAISPANRAVWTDGRSVRCGVLPESPLLQEMGVVGRPRAAVFDVKGRLLLALDRLGKPTTVVQGEFDANGQLSKVAPLFTIKMGNAVGIFIDKAERICVVAHTGKLKNSFSMLYRHPKLVDSAPQFYPWTPALNPHKYWRTFTPHLRRVLYTVMTSLASGMRSLPRIPAELVLAILKDTVLQFRGRTWIPGATEGMRFLD